MLNIDYAIAIARLKIAFLETGTLPSSPQAYGVADYISILIDTLFLLLI